MARKLESSVLAHLREVAATRADSPGARIAEQGPKTEHALPALTRIAGRFSIERALGQGGMGSVYLAFDHLRSRRVALKIVHAGDPSLDVRFEREAVALESLIHPAIVRHETHGKTEDGTWFMATEVLHGRTLKQRLSTSLLSVAEAAWLGARLGEVLAYVHDRALVHRDLTPANIFLCDDGSLKLLDFGLTAFAGGSHTLTGQGAMIGTMGFVSPEQASGGELDGRSDLFSLGCVLVAALTGRPPFGTAVAELLAKLDREIDPAQIVPQSVPARMRDVLRDLLQRDRAKRPASGLEVAARLAPLAGTGLGEPLATCVPIANEGPDPAAAFRWMSARGPMMTVVVKQTLALTPGTAKAAFLQEPVLFRDRCQGGEPAQPVVQPSDVAPFKPWTDVVLVGRVGPAALAAGTERRLRVGGLDKRIEVDAAGALVGCGPLAPSDPSRASQLAPTANAWLTGVPANAPVPSPGFFCAAPPDQRLESPLDDQEPIRLDGLVEGHVSLTSRLPGRRPRAAFRRGGETRELELRADTLLIDVERAICSVTWRAQLAAEPAEGLEILVGAVVSDSSAVRRSTQTTPDDLMSYTLSSSGGPIAAPLPFRRDPEPSGAAAPASSEMTRQPRNRAGIELLWTELQGDAQGETAKTLAEADAWTTAELEAALASTLAQGGPPPVVVVSGSLELPAEDVERARALVALAGALDSKSPGVGSAIEAVRRALATEMVLEPVVARAAAALAAALRADGADLGPVDRALVLRRAYQRRLLLGGPHLRALLHMKDGDAIPCYMPDVVVSQLPLATRFGARLLVEVLPRKDDEESSALCLRVRGVARTHD